MTETIQQLKEDIAILQMKLQKLEETKSPPAEEAYKRVYGFYPETYEDSWSAFQDGFFEGCKVEEPDESVEDYLKPQTPDKIEENLREAFKKVQQTEEWKETQKLIDSNYNELVESGTEPPEPTSTVFRQKLFDGIKSVFYDPDYERIHWKMKVDMAVDEVLTHFYDVIPKSQEPVYGDFDEGWDSCLKCIEMRMEHTDD